jgi:hypothetical protein
MKTLKIALLSVAALVAGILYLENPVGAQITNLGPSMTTVTAGASATLAALPANPSRHALTICNGHASQSVTFTFGALTPVSLTTGMVLPGNNVVASCFTTPGSISAGIGAQVNVIASGASTPVTFFEY